MKQNIKNSGFALPVAVLIIFGLLVVGGGIYYVTQSSDQNMDVVVNSTVDSETMNEEDALVNLNSNTNVEVGESEEEEVEGEDVSDQPAYLINAYSQNNKNYIDVDYIEVLSGSASLQAQVAAGDCPNVNDCYDFPNGYKKNQNPLVRTFEVSANAPIKSAWNPYPETNFITFTEFKNSTQSATFTTVNPPFQTPKAYIRINVLNDIVTSIDRPYQE